MADKPRNTYALGAFCQLVMPYMTESSRTIAGFMKDYFDAIIDTDQLEKDPSPHENVPNPGKSSITAGPWRGINESDLRKFYNGQRRLPSWKAGRFLKHLDQSKIEELCAGIGVDALGQFQRTLGEFGIVVQSVAEVPTAVYRWLSAILESNVHKQDLLVDGLSAPAQLDLFEGIRLAEGRISGGKLQLGRSSLPWQAAPAAPSTPDPELESGYTSQMLAAFGDHLKQVIPDFTKLPEKLQQEFTRQRGYFYGAEGVRRNLRDVVEDGEDEFGAMKTDLFDGVSGVCSSDHANALVRMRATLSHAASFPLNGSVITHFPSIIKSAEKQGMCHMLANDELLEWVQNDE